MILAEVKSSVLKMSPVVIACIPPVVWTALLLLVMSPENGQSCMEAAWSSGYMTSGHVENFTFDESRTSSCRCCAFCHQIKTCASLSYNTDTHQCQLYSSVAGYDSLTPDESWKYWVMPGRSEHQQFCRWNSDCQAKGDFCRGRVCTERRAVTCRVIFETFGAGERYYGYFIPRMFGWLNDTDVALACMMGPGFHGYTRLVKNKKENHELNTQNLMSYNTVLDPDVKPHSILSLAEYIRLAGNGTTYSIKIFRWDQMFMIDFQMPRTEPVLSNHTRSGIGNGTVSKGGRCINFDLSPPYLPATGGPTLLTINAGDPEAIDGSIVRTDGKISWKECGVTNMLIYIRE